MLIEMADVSHMSHPNLCGRDDLARTPYSDNDLKAWQMRSHVQVADMVTRLSTGDWFTAKVSACGLFTAAYKHISEHDQRTLLRAQVCVRTINELFLLRCQQYVGCRLLVFNCCPYLGKPYRVECLPEMDYRGR